MQLYGFQQVIITTRSSCLNPWMSKWPDRLRMSSDCLFKISFILATLVGLLQLFAVMDNISFTTRLPLLILFLFNSITYTSFMNHTIMYKTM